jgi:pyruvate/2-oxoglutarate dehydrogenase complex dihydrolipoamide dehydrogenase (E3) component
MTQRFDIAIVGAGSAGLIGADFAARVGAKVALLESGRIGGDCTWTGCVPSKALLRAGHIAHDARRAGAFGIDVGEPRADMRRVRSRVHDTIAQIYQHTTPDELHEREIDVFLGPTRFADPHTLVTGEQRIHAGRVVICTGARAKVPELPGLNNTPFLTYDRLFDLDELPGHLVVLGAGPLGVEMAQAFGRLGASVTVIGPRVLAREEAETQKLMSAVLEREDIRVVLARGTRVRATSIGIEVDTPQGPIAGDKLLVAAGRAPRVEGLELQRAGVRYSDRGIPVDAYLRTNVRHIFACGDVIGGAQFSHLAGWQCFRAVRNALLPGKSAARPIVLPAVTFTDPEVARVGWTEAEAREHLGDALHVHTTPITKADRAVCDGEPDGFIKLITRRNGKILGATIVASRAGEMIGEVALAMEQGLGVAAIAGTIHAYPTWSSAIQLAAVDIMMARLQESRLFRLARRWSGLQH